MLKLTRAITSITPSNNLFKAPACSRLTYFDQLFKMKDPSLMAGNPCHGLNLHSPPLADLKNGSYSSCSWDLYMMDDGRPLSFDCYDRFTKHFLKASLSSSSLTGNGKKKSEADFAFSTYQPFVIPDKSIIGLLYSLLI